MLRNQEVINPRLLTALERYVVDGKPSGSFMRAFIAGDLHAAFRRADLESSRCMKAMHMFLVNYAPADCYGTQENYRRWLAEGGSPESFKSVMQNRFEKYRSEHYETA